jgi:hypothetical protein
MSLADHITEGAGVPTIAGIHVHAGTAIRGDESTATEVHATLCALVTTQAVASSAWSEYALVLLDAATAAFFAARLSDARAAQHLGGESDTTPPSKKRKVRGDGSESYETASDEDADAVVCEHCGGAVPEVSLRVACLDGTTLDVTVAQRGLVREVKRLVGQVRVVP